jgi:hypothetical protein
LYISEKSWQGPEEGNTNLWGILEMSGNSPPVSGCTRILTVWIEQVNIVMMRGSG